MTALESDTPLVRRPLDAERVVSAAAEIADAEGLDKLTLTRVADVVSVSVSQRCTAMWPDMTTCCAA